MVAYCGWVAWLVVVVVVVASAVKMLALFDVDYFRGVTCANDEGNTSMMEMWLHRIATRDGISASGAPALRGGVPPPNSGFSGNFGKFRGA